MKKIALVCMVLAALSLAYAGQVVIGDLGAKRAAQSTPNKEVVKTAPVENSTPSLADLKSQLEMLEAEMVVLENSGDVARMEVIKAEITEILNTLEPSDERTPGSRLDAVGDDCTQPLPWVVGAVPSSLLNQTNCLRLNDYPDVACFGNYDSGEDMIIELQATADLGFVRLKLDPKGTTYGAVGIGTMCPPTTCLAYVGSSIGTVKYTTGFNCPAGTYYIMVDTWSTPYCIANFDLTIEVAPAPPANDLCANAITVAIPSVTAATTVLATADVGIAACGTATYSGRLGVWYKVVGNDHFLTAHTCATTFDTQLWVLEGGCGVLTCVNADDDGCAPGSSVTWCAGLGVEYLIYVAHYSSSTGNFTLTIVDGGSCLDPDGRCCYGEDPLNPLCAVTTESDCATLGGEWTIGEVCLPDPPYGCPVPCPFPNRDIEPNETCTEAQPIYCNEDLCGDITPDTDVDFYALTIPEGICYELDINVYADDTPGQWPYGQGLDPYLYIYGSDCATVIDYRDDGGTGYDTYLHTVCLTAGTYFLKIYTPYGVPGPYVLSVDCIPCECPSECILWVDCGTPTETEPNNVCPTELDAHVFTCDDLGYGMICPETESDYYLVTIPPMTYFSMTFFDGVDCGVYPPACVRLDLLYEDCSSAGITGNFNGWYANWAQPTPLNLIVRMYSIGGCQATYKIETMCCALEGTDYCASPIMLPLTTYYQVTMNTGPGANTVPYSGSDCAAAYTRTGNDLVFAFEPSVGHCAVDIDVYYLGADECWWLFTDCADPVGSCVASSDDEYDIAGGTNHETRTNISVSNGTTYYLQAGRYSGCGLLTVTISSNCILPVEFLSADALAGNGSVTVSWATASESDLDRYEIVRDGEMVKTISASNTTQRHDYSWVDTYVTNGMSYSYDIVVVGVNSERNVLATVNATPSFEAGAVTEYALHQNYPNPFNPTTTMAFDLKDAGFVNLTVFNLMGQEVAKVISGEMSAGRHTVNFNSGSLSSGIYLYRIEVNGFVAENKMLLMK